MSEYIERTPELTLAANAGARAIENTKRYHGAIYTRDVFGPNKAEIAYLQAAKVLRTVEDAPAADVAPVVHGRWVNAGRGIKACSNCNHGIKEHMACANHYCPNCGAKMDGGGDA